MDDERLSNGHWLKQGTLPVVIAGPCAAESEAQVHEAALRLSGGPARYLRAGVWKPRTRPNTFEGIGTPALAWLRDAGRAHGMATATEVAHARHVEAALEHGIDLLWIGARTTASPFSVQEVAHALRGTSVAVLVKNPTSPDVDLWVGAVERLLAAGVKQLGVVHRGFSMGDRRVYRNVPLWELAIELRRRMPELPMICDPSHIAGRRDLVEHVCQLAMDLGMDGLMIEAHPAPDQAWSDAEQQVTPERATQIVTSLRVPRPATDDPVANLSLRQLRDTIDERAGRYAAAQAGGQPLDLGIPQGSQQAVGIVVGVFLPNAVGQRLSQRAARSIPLVGRGLAAELDARPVHVAAHQSQPAGGDLGSVAAADLPRRRRDRRRTPAVPGAARSCRCSRPPRRRSSPRRRR